MLNTKRIKWMYEHFGVASAIKSVGYDLHALLIYICYCMTLPFRFFLILWKEMRKSKL